MCTQRKEQQLTNLLEKPVYFLQMFKNCIHEDGTAYVSKERKFLPHTTFAEALEEVRKERLRGYYDRVELYRMRGVVDSVQTW